MRTLFTVIFIAILSLVKADDGMWWLERDDRFVSDTVIALPASSGHERVVAETRVAMKRMKNDNSENNSFGFTWRQSDGSKIEVRATPLPSDYDTFIENYKFKLQVSEFDNDGNKRILETKMLNKDLGYDEVANSLRLEIDRDKSVKVKFGKSYLHTAATFGDELADPSDCNFFIDGRGRIDFLSCEWRDDRSLSLASPWTIGSLNDYMSAGDIEKYEGFWQYLDRSIDERYAVAGGRYTLALVKNADSGYDIIYVSGAEINSQRWKPGMLKGRLYPTIFEGNFNLEWWDAEMNLFEDDTYVQFDQDAVMTVEIPVYKATMRFSKMPMGR